MKDRYSELYVWYSELWLRQLIPKKRKVDFDRNIIDEKLKAEIIPNCLFVSRYRDRSYWNKNWQIWKILQKWSDSSDLEARCVNMPEYGFSLTCVLPYKDRIVDFFYTGKHGPDKTRLAAYFAHWQLPLNLRSVHFYKAHCSKKSRIFHCGWKSSLLYLLISDVPRFGPY